MYLLCCLWADSFDREGFDSGLHGPYHARAMGHPLRDRRTPLELAESGQVIEIFEKISNFERLAGIVRSDVEALEPDTLPHDWQEARVEGRLEFGFADAQRQLAALEGHVAVTVDAVCQRCLAPMRLPLVVDARLLFGDGSPDSTRNDGYEVWEPDEGRLRPLDLVEELLIMAMPLSALHDDDKCNNAGTEDGAGETTRPFANLRSRMDKKS